MSGSTSSRAAALYLGGALLGSAALFALPWIRADHFGPFVGRRWMVVFGAATLLHSVAFFGPRRFRAAWCVASLTTVFSIYLFEAALVYDFVEPDAAAEAQVIAWKNAQPNYDHRLKLEVIEDLRAAGADAWPDSGKGTFFTGLDIDGRRVVPISGVATATTVYCNESGQRAVYVSDEHGFNNPLGLYDRDADIVIVGDSFAHGACVQSGEDVASQLRLRLPDRRIVNLGYGGAGPLTLQAMLAEYAERLHPRDVFWFYFSGNDLTDMKEELLSDVLTHYLDDIDFRQNLWDDQAKIDRAMRAFITRQEEDHRRAGGQWRPAGFDFRAIAKLNSIRRMFQLKPLPDPHATFARAARQAKQRVEAWGGRLYFVYIPHFPHETDGGLQRRDEVLAVIEELDVPIVDFAAHVRTLDDPGAHFSSPYGGHLDARGYRLLAEDLARTLRE